MQRAFRPVIIGNAYPELDCGRYPVKREVGDRLEVWFDLAALVKYWEKGAPGWSETPMRLYENDRPTGGFTLAKDAGYEYTIEAWTDEFGTWRTEVGKKVEAGQNAEQELIEGRGLVEDTFSATGEGVRDDGGLVCGSEGFRRGAP